MGSSRKVGNKGAGIGRGIRRAVEREMGKTMRKAVGREAGKTMNRKVG
jgi:hypothetical protein